MYEEADARVTSGLIKKPNDSNVQQVYEHLTEALDTFFNLPVGTSFVLVIDWNSRCFACSSCKDRTTFKFAPRREQLAKNVLSHWRSAHGDYLKQEHSEQSSSVKQPSLQIRVDTMLLETGTANKDEERGPPGVTFCHGRLDRFFLNDKGDKVECSAVIDCPFDEAERLGFKPDPMYVPMKDRVNMHGRFSSAVPDIPYDYAARVGKGNVRSINCALILDANPATRPMRSPGQLAICFQCCNLHTQLGFKQRLNLFTSQYPDGPRNMSTDKLSIHAARKRILKAKLRKMMEQ